MVDHEAVFAYFTEEMTVHAGSALKSVVVYGSSLTDEFRPRVSDYNFLVVAEPIDMALLDRLATRAGKWRRKRITPPLLVTPSFIEHALDSYPLEFLSMGARHRLLYPAGGADPLRDLSIDRTHVRLQCEREIRSKLLLFRRAYLESEGAPRRLQQLIERGLPSLLAIFRGILYLKDGPWQVTGEELWRACGTHVGISDELLRALDEIRGRRSAPAREAIRAQIGEILEGLQALAGEVDQWS